MFDAQEMIGNFHDTTTAVATGDERQGNHINSEKADNPAHGTKVANEG